MSLTKTERRLTVQDRIDRSISEAAFQDNVIAMAHTFGWRVAHFRSVRVQKKDGTVRYRTPVQADGAGFPDLLMTRGLRIVAVELKKQLGEVSKEQLAWLAALRIAGAETHVWRPADMRSGAIEEALR